MLKTQLHHHAYAEASASLETLAMAMDLVPEVIRGLGVEVVMSLADTSREALTLLKLLLSRQHRHVRCEDVVECIPSCVLGHKYIYF